MLGLSLGRYTTLAAEYWAYGLLVVDIASELETARSCDISIMASWGNALRAAFMQHRKYSISRPIGIYLRPRLMEFKVAYHQVLGA